MKSCPKCKSENLIKNGFNEGRQRYNCKDCGRNSSVKHVGYPPSKRRLVLKMYLEGVSMRGISRILNLGIATVVRWIALFGKELEPEELPESVEIGEMDELYHWVGKKTKNMDMDCNLQLYPTNSQIQNRQSWLQNRQSLVGLTQRY